jgi:hypothetical protein
MRKLILILWLIPFTAVYAQNNSNWLHLGPLSKNLTGGDLFETGRAECVAVDPSNSSKLYVGSFGGLWKTTDGGSNWTSMEPNPLYYSGASAAIVASTGALYVASTEITRHTTKGIYILTGTTWSSLITLPTTQQYVINHFQFFPGSTSIMFACTSVGIFRSADGGATWGSGAIGTATEEYENIAFVPGATTGTYICYATGGNKLKPVGIKVFKESTDQGLTFSTVTAVTNLLTWTNVYADLCTGDVSTVNKEVFIFAALNGTSSAYKIFKMIKNTSTGTITCIDYYTPSNIIEYDINADRLAIAYTSNKKLFFGGVAITGLDVSTATPSPLTVNYMHTDQHDLGVIPSLNKVISAGDGGFSYGDYTTSTTTFTRLNNGLDISQLHGFSGSATDPNFFVTGEQDTKGFVFTYNAGSSTTIKNFGNEPTGALVDKFNTNRIFANADGFKYRTTYYISNDHGATFPIGGDATHANDNFWPINNQATFEASTNIESEPSNFGTHTFYQDPARPDKIYSGTCNLNQYDPLHNVFACKLRMGVVFASGPIATRCCSFYSQVLSMGISTQDKNGFYFTTMKHPIGGPAGPTASQVIKFVGPDIDNTWVGHNEDQTNWQVITPDLKATPFNYTSLTDADIYTIEYTSSAISQMDKEKLWVGLNDVPALDVQSGNPVIKVLFYNHGTWSNYSEGLQLDDHITSMVGERGSNDGIYLNTLRGVYYRNASLPAWVLYSTNFPKIASKQMEINYTDNTVRAGTYGQGIWRSPLSCPLITTDIVKSTILTPFEFTETKAGITSTAVIPSGNTVYYRAGTQITLSDGFVAAQGCYYDAFIHGCDSPGSSFFRTAKDEELMEEVIKKIKEQADEFSIYPNPNDGSFTLNFPPVSEEEMEQGEEAENDVYIFDVMGKIVFEKKQATGKAITIDLSAYPKGIYMVRVVDEDGNGKVKKVVIQ